MVSNTKKQNQILINRIVSMAQNPNQMQSQNFKVIKIQNLQYQPYDGVQDYQAKQVWSDWGSRKILTYQQTCKSSLYAQFNNGFFGAFLKAYNHHGDVKITPDDVWLVIILQFSKYVNENAQQLRSAFVSHQGKKKLVVTTYNQRKQSQWDEFFDLMIAQIKKNTTKGVTEKLECNFSTTQRVQRIFSTAVIMNTYKKYFDYERQIAGCGIKNVHFGGTLEDWKSVHEKLLQLSEFDVNGELKGYIERVSVILQQFIETYQGKVDLDFWNKIVNKYQGRKGSSRTSYFSGWLIHFFGYLHDTQKVTIEAMDLEIKIDNKITNKEKKVKLVGGFAAISKQGDIFRPHLSMAILLDQLQQDNSEEKEESLLQIKQKQQVKHKQSEKEKVQERVLQNEQNQAPEQESKRSNKKDTCCLIM